MELEEDSADPCRHHLHRRHPRHYQGDEVNNTKDGNINISDIASLIDLLLSGGEIPAGADVNGDGQVNISDVTALIDKLLSGN